MTEYDVVIIGAGPAGYVGAIRAPQLGKRTAIVDRQWLGGVCLNVGCIPSKALLKNAEVAHTLRERGKEFGFEVQGLKLDYAAAVKRSRQVSDRLVKGVGFLMKKNKIDVHMGTAQFTGPHTLRVQPDLGEPIELQAKDIIVATGARAALLPGVQADGQRILTYLEAILQETMPASVIVIGGSAIGLEFATVWNSYGADVTIVEMLPRLAPLEDEEVGKELAKAFAKRGMKIMTGSRVEAIEALKTKVKVRVMSEAGEQTLEADQALVAIGIKANSDNLGLEAAGVKLSPRGFIEVDDRMATNVPGV